MHRHLIMPLVLFTTMGLCTINIVTKEGKDKLKHLKNLMKENEICTMKYIDKIYHNDESLMLMHFMCII